MAFLILAAVFVGFARSYYLAGVFQAPLPNRLVHIHGAIFTCWILLLITQTLLVSAGRVDIHRRLGLVGFGLACIMPVVAIYAAVDSMVRHAGRPNALAFFAVAYSTFWPSLRWFFARNVSLDWRSRLILIANDRDIKPIRRLAHTCFQIQSIPRSPQTEAFHTGWVRLRSFLVVDSSGHTEQQDGLLLVFLQHERGPIGQSHSWQTFAAGLDAARSDRG